MCILFLAPSVYMCIINIVQLVGEVDTMKGTETLGPILWEEITPISEKLLASQTRII